MQSLFQSFIISLPGAVSTGIIWGIMAIGVYITYKVLDLADLTVDGSFATGGAVLAVMLNFNINIYICLICAFLAGCLAGFVTGILHTKFGIPAILAGILSQLALYSINLRILDGSNLTVGLDKVNMLLSSRNDMKAMLVGGAFAVVIIAALYWFFGTERGHSVRATGANAAMSRANGINTETNKVLGLVLSNGIVAIAGALLTKYSGSADINKGRGAIVIGLAAVIIGEVLFSKIFKNFALRLLSAVLGGVIYYIAMTFIVQLGLDTNDLNLFTAMLVALFLGVPYWKSKIAPKRVKSVAYSDNTNAGGESNA